MKMRIRADNLAFVIPPDRRFTTSPDVGTPDCICSRCGQPILENEVPVRMWPEDFDYEYRFHPRCLGFQTAEGVELDDDDPHEAVAP